MSENSLRKILQRFAFDYTYIEGERKIDQVLVEIVNYLKAKMPKKKGDDYYSSEDDPNYYKNGHNDTIDAMTEILEKEKE